MDVNRRTPRLKYQAEGGASSSIADMPWEIMLELVQRMDSEDRSAWRLVNKAACQAVYEGTTALAATCIAPEQQRSALPLRLLSKCSGLERLSCRGLERMRNIQGLPPGLRALDISWTPVTDLSPLRQCTGLRQLSANSIRDGIHLTVEQAAALLQQIGSMQLTGLQRLELVGNRLGKAGIQGLGPALQHLTGLQRLELGDNRLRDEGARALAPALQRLTRLQRLELSRNKLGAKGITALAPSIKELRALQSLDLGNNHLNAEAAHALALALRELTGLQVLRLTNCHLTALAAQALAPAIKALPRLQVGLSDQESTMLDQAVAALAVDA